MQNLLFRNNLTLTSPPNTKYKIYKLKRKIVLQKKQEKNENNLIFHLFFVVVRIPFYPLFFAKFSQLSI